MKKILIALVLLIVMPYALADCDFDAVCEAGEDSSDCAWDCGLIVDHHAVAAFDDIPDEWLEQAKQFTMHFGHASHGAHPAQGMQYLEDEVDSVKYSYAYYCGSESCLPTCLPPAEDPPAFRLYDRGYVAGVCPSLYTDTDQYWETSAGMDLTRSIADSGEYELSMFTWCKELSTHTPGDGYVDQYLSAMDMLESEYPGMRFIFSTGIYDDYFDQDVVDTNTKPNNDQIRQYAIENNKILYDTRDIEIHDPDGVLYPYGSDSC